MLAKFFELNQPFQEVGQAEFYDLLRRSDPLIQNILYRPEKLASMYTPWRHRVKNISFVNVSFRQTEICDFEFTNCKFDSCLLVGTLFKNCRFTSCAFLGCNTHRVEFQACYVNPESFAHCILNRQFANIAIYLYQELLRNSRDQAQPDFAEEAKFQFSRWKRILYWNELRKADATVSYRASRFLELAGMSVFEVTSGYGTKLSRLSLFSIVLLIALSVINWSLAGVFGLQQGNAAITEFNQAFYFTTVVTTTLGFGDISPTTAIGRVAVSAEAIMGFIMFAVLTSTLYRRFTS